MTPTSAEKADKPHEMYAESLRLTAFPTPSVQIAPTNWWSQLVGTPPEITTSKPSKGEVQESGPVGPNNLVLQVQPFRIDWILAARSEETESGGENWLGPFSEVMQLFKPLMTKWLGNSPPIVRLAFGAVVFEPVEDRSAGYQRLAEYLHSVSLDPEGSRDFLYQINRPRKSAVIDGLVINRLSRWSVSAFIPLRVMFTPQLIQPKMGESRDACRIEVDINTAAEFGAELSANKLPSIFEELTSQGELIITKGDVA